MIIIANMPIIRKIRENPVLYTIPIFLMNIILKGIYLTDQEIGLDEPFTIYHAQFDVPVIIDLLKGYNNPPLYEILLHFWIKAFGISPLAVRTFPLIFACLCPVALFYFGQKFFSLKIGILSSLLLSFSDLLTYYSHDCRVYTLFLLLSILSMHFFLNITYSDNKGPKNSVGYIFFSSLLIYAHYFGFFILFFQALHTLLFYRKHIYKVVGYFTAIALIYLPHILVVVRRMTDSFSQGTWLHSPDGLVSLYNMLWSFSNFPFITVSAIILLASALFIVIKNRGYNHINPNMVLIIIWFVFAYLGMFFISYFVPMYLNRYLIYALPAYYILLIACIDFLFRRKMANTVVCVYFVVSFASIMELNPNKHQHVEKAMNWIRKFKDDKTLVFYCQRDLFPQLIYNYNRSYFASIFDSREYYLMDSLSHADNIYHLGDVSVFPKLSNNEFNRILVFGDREKCNGLTNEITNTLNKKYVKLHTEQFSNSSYQLTIYMAH
jgi:mannosyltransferase